MHESNYNSFDRKITYAIDSINNDISGMRRTSDALKLGQKDFNAKIENEYSKFTAYREA